MFLDVEQTYQNITPARSYKRAKLFDSVQDGSCAQQGKNMRLQKPWLVAFPPVKYTFKLSIILVEPRIEPNIESTHHTERHIKTKTHCIETISLFAYMIIKATHVTWRRSVESRYEGSWESCYQNNLSTPESESSSSTWIYEWWSKDGKSDDYELNRDWITW